MKLNNRYTILLLIIFIQFFATSCKKALEENPFSFIAPENFYKNGDDAKTAINGAYNVLYSWDMYRQPFWNLTMLDEDHVSGADWFLGTSGAGNPQGYWGVDGPWVGCYSMIARANSVIENVSAMTDNIEADMKQRILGEAHFLRGWAYFQLVQLYGGVPIRLHSLGVDPESNIPRSTVMETYQVIIDEFKAAEENLFPRGDSKSGELGRATRGLAKAFLAKTYLTIASGALSGVNITVRGGEDNNYYTHTKTVVAGLEDVDAQQYFTLARDKAMEVIESEEYALFPNWQDIWKKENRNKQEHMWMVQSLASSDFTNNLHNYFSAYSSFGRGAVWMTNHHYLEYEDQDTRVLNGVVHNYRTNTGTPYFYPSWQAAQYKVVNGVTYNNNGGTDDRAYVTKFASVADSTASNSDAYFPLMRYAEVLLIYAEAANEAGNGPTIDAYKYLNEVRERAHASAAPDAMTRDQFRDFIISERAREFALEGIRRFDLMRWGIYLQVMNQITVGQDNISKVRSQRNLLLPIPLGELNSNKAITANNPGW